MNLRTLVTKARTHTQSDSSSTTHRNGDGENSEKFFKRHSYQYDLFQNDHLFTVFLSVTNVKKCPGTSSKQLTFYPCLLYLNIIEEVRQQQTTNVITSHGLERRHRDDALQHVIYFYICFRNERDALNQSNFKR